MLCVNNGSSPLQICKFGTIILSWVVNIINISLENNLGDRIKWGLRTWMANK